MRWVLCFGVLMLAGCQTSAPGPLLGTWRSDEELTLREIEGAELTPEQREILTEPGFFGQLELRYEVGRVHSLYEGSGSWSPYGVVASGDGFVQIEYMDPLTGKMTQPRLLIEDDLMKMPVRDLGFYEVFRRVQSEEALCVDRTP